MTRRSFTIATLAGVTGAVLQAADELHLLLVPNSKSFHLGDPIRITWLLENLSKSTLSVIAFRDSGGSPQFDELTLSISHNNGPWQTISLSRPRAATHIVWRDLQPGATLFQQFDLAAAMNEAGLKLEPGSYRLKGEYSMSAMRTDAGRPSWSGHVASDPTAEFTLD